MFKLVQSGPTGGDETAMHSVQFSGPIPTLGEFMEDLIANHSGDWGCLDIRDEHANKIGGAFYSHGTFESDNIPDVIKKHRIQRISASGGWSRMDYLVKV